MGKHGARQGDKIEGVDVHITMIPAAGGVLTPTPIPGYNFSGALSTGLSINVRINGRPAAIVGSEATNMPPHIPMTGVAFQVPPTNIGQVVAGSATVRINGKPAARDGDLARTCNDISREPSARVVVTPVSQSVIIGG